MALIENIQREDLNPIEESLALIRLQDEFKLTQQQVADAVGKSRSAVTNLMRLATLELSVQSQVERGELECCNEKLARPQRHGIGFSSWVGQDRYHSEKPRCLSR